MIRSFLLVVVCTFMISIIAQAELIVQIKLERDGTTWTTLDPSLVVVEEDAGNIPVVYDTLPDPDSVGNKDLQEWYISTEDGNGFNLLTFLASAVGIPLPQGNKDSQYWIRYGYGTIFSQVADYTITKPSKPVPK